MSRRDVHRFPPARTAGMAAIWFAFRIDSVWRFDVAIRVYIYDILTSNRLGVFPTRGRLRDADAVAPMANNAFIASIGMVDSPILASEEFVATLWRSGAFPDARIWFGRANSADNPADLPDRGIFPFPHSFAHVHLYAGGLITPKSLRAQNIPNYLPADSFLEKHMNR